jgi:hypothetical protein
VIEYANNERTPEAQARLDKYGSSLDAHNVQSVIDRIADYPEIVAAARALPVPGDARPPLCPHNVSTAPGFWCSACAADPVPGDARLTQDQRRSLGCDCWRLDGEWHHKPKCPVPTVEAILRNRLPEATTVTEWGVRYGDGECEHAGQNVAEVEQFIASLRNGIQERHYEADDYEPMTVVRRTVTRYTDHYGPWEQVTE